MLEDEIERLRDQLRETVDENGRLYKLLKERDFEIKHLKKKIEEDRFAFTGSSTAVATVSALKSRWAGPAAVEAAWVTPLDLMTRVLRDARYMFGGPTAPILSGCSGSNTVSWMRKSPSGSRH